MQLALGALKCEGVLQGCSGLVVGFEERQRIVGKSVLDALAERYST